jgi:AraC-like DNA-binding protein
MGVVFHADAEPRASRRDYWQHVLDGTFGPAVLRMHGDLGAGDRLRLADAGAVRVAELSISGRNVAERAWTHIRGLDRELYKVAVHARGRAVVEQEDRRSAPSPGDLTFVDLSRPCRWDYASAEFVSVAFPRALLPLPPDRLAPLTGLRIPGDRGLGALVVSVARQLPDRLDECSPADRARLGATVVDLVTAILASRIEGGRGVPPSSRPRALLMRVLAFIEERLGDPELSPAHIAAAHHISVSYLYRLFGAEERPVAEWIRLRRIDRARHDLLDPALRHTPVSAIATRWGFTSAAQFSRAFRTAHGLPPGEYRAALGGGARRD